MNANDILNSLDIGEDTDWEFKAARGGTPHSLWETYSAMANTNGGTIVLGIGQHGDTFTVDGLENVRKTKKEFWDAINNRGKVSTNLLGGESLAVQEVRERDVLVVEVPRANRRQRPVYVGQNPLEGTYRRNYEGDYKCRPEEVGRMLADQADEPADSVVLEHFTVDDLDPTSVQQYRRRFSARSPEHPWLAEDEADFLSKLGAWRRDRHTGLEGLTVAGLLMFGRNEAISDPAAIPEFHLDYREWLTEDPNGRWSDRRTYDGTWVCNVFQFYQRVVGRLTEDLKTPFQLQADLARKDDTVVHEAVREALVNSLIHADYRGQGGVVVEKHRDRLEFSNPGTLLLDVEQILRGGVSECRNKTVQKMFSLLGYGEKAGSGFDKIRQGWASQKWRLPSIEETFRPDRVRLVLPMVSLLPAESLERLRTRFGTRLKRLNPLEIQALVTADIENAVSNARMRQLSGKHPSDLTRLLQGLVGKRFLYQVGQKRGASYRLPGSAGVGLEGDSLHKVDSLRNGAEDSLHKPKDLSESEKAKLWAIVAPALLSPRLAPEQTRSIILQLCDSTFFTAAELGELMSRNPDSLRNRFLTPMVEEGLLIRRFPAEPNRPDQAYTAKRQEAPQVPQDRHGP